MCGRFNLRANLKQLDAAFGVTPAGELKPRFNIAPTQMVACIRPGKELAMLRWGLIPSWARDPKIAFSLINARGETVAEKPAYRTAFKKRRCLIPASGFYEWAKVGTKKLPHHFHMKDDSLFAFAGLWESWHSEKGDPIESCTIVTTEANELVKPFHDRMPVILPAKAYDEWLDAQSTPDELRGMLVPFPANKMTEEAISTVVNSPKNEGPTCIEPMTAN